MWWLDLQILFPIAHVSPWTNLEQEFLCYELTDFLFLSSRVFLRSCSFNFTVLKTSVFLPWTTNCHLENPRMRDAAAILNWIQGSSLRIKPTEISSTCRGEPSAFRTFTKNGLTFFFYLLTFLLTLHDDNVGFSFYKAETTKINWGLFLWMKSFPPLIFIMVVLFVAK